MPALCAVVRGGPLHLAFRAREGSGDVADDKEGVFPPHCSEMGFSSIGYSEVE